MASTDYDDLKVFLKNPSVIDPARVIDLMHEVVTNENIAVELKEYAHTLLAKLKDVATRYEPSNGSEQILKTQILASRTWAMLNNLVKPLLLGRYAMTHESGEPVTEQVMLLGRAFDDMFRSAILAADNHGENCRQAIRLQEQEFIHMTDSMTNTLTRIIGDMSRDGALNTTKVVLRRMGMEASELTFIGDTPVVKSSIGRCLEYGICGGTCATCMFESYSKA
jgi:hypothetical protein